MPCRSRELDLALSLEVTLPLIGSIRRESLDHAIALNEQHPKRILTCCFDY